jgi:pentatricopeptide repeat protein
MDEGKMFDQEAVHRDFAKRLNSRTWELLNNVDRTEEDDLEMEYGAVSSLYHWSQCGTALHKQRGEWLLAHVYTILGYSAASLRHATRCHTITLKYPDLMQDFDLAYAYEGMARSLALAGEMEEAKSFFQKAKEAGVAINNEEDRTIFLGDLEAGDWFGLT